jgi:hypothetical protein
MHKLLLKSLVKAHRKIEANRQILLTRIAKLEALASKHASKNNPEALEILDRLWLLKKRI